MKIFDIEKSLAELMENSKSSICIAINISDNKEDDLISSLKSIKNKDLSKILAKVSEFDHPDMVYGSAILASTVMNKNDDIFLPEETWAARKTPINTPFNQNHVENEIIGHIINSRVYDKDHNLVESSDIPDYFDIEVDFVVYKDIFPKVAADIYENAPKGKKFVSMEARFNNFDYGIQESDGSISIVERNKDTAFLTKFLRIYGGTGVFEDKKIGRVLRDFRFTGMGLVENPANPASEFTKLDKADISNGSVLINRIKGFYIVKGNIMKVETLEQANTVIADLLKKNEELSAQVNKNEIEAVKAEKTKVDNDLVASNSKLTIAEKKIEEVSAALEALKKQFDEISTAKTELETKLGKIETDTKSAARLAKLAEVGFTPEKDQADSFISMSEVAFDSVIKFASQHNKKETEVTNKTEAATEEKKAEDALKTEKTEAKKEVDNTEGDTETEVQKLEKTAAKLIEAFRNSNKVKAKTKKNSADKK